MGIKDDQYQLCPAPNTKIADASLKCQTTCEEMENKVKAEVKDGLNHYQRNFGSRSSSSALPGKSETYDHYLNPQQYRQVTESVSRYYALLARDLETIAWPKVAAVVSYQFGCNIDNFMEGGWSRNPFLGVGTPQQNDDVAVALGEGVTRIFKNLYPLVRMIADYGPAAFLACVDAGEIELKPPRKWCRLPNLCLPRIMRRLIEQLLNMSKELLRRLCMKNLTNNMNIWNTPRKRRK